MYSFRSSHLLLNENCEKNISKLDKILLKVITAHFKWFKWHKSQTEFVQESLIICVNMLHLFLANKDRGQPLIALIMQDTYHH